MLIKSLKIVNFRQFLGEHDLHFSTNSKKNVTVFMGENGSGKTSCAQAFTWCFYGATGFQDQFMLNKILETNMTPGNKEKVVVEVELIHDERTYFVKREQEYSKTRSGKLSVKNTDFNIAYKVEGQQEFSANPDLQMKQILPKDLSSYFFFDGEHISSLTKELSKGKSKEFANAVEKLLGLKAILEALNHLKPTRQNTVISRFNSQYDDTSNKEISEINSEIEAAKEELDRIDKRLGELEDGIETGQDNCDELAQKIRANQKSTDLQAQKDEYEQRIKTNKEKKKGETLILLEQFNKNGYAFFSKKLISDSVSLLSKENILNQGIPEIHQRTIEFLINRNVCICGTEIVAGEEPHRHLLETLDYIPPKSIGTMIEQYNTFASQLIQNSETFYNTITTHFTRIREIENDTDSAITLLEEAEELIKDLEDVGQLQEELSYYQKLVDEHKDERDTLLLEKGEVNERMSRKESQLSEFALKSEKNKKIELYKAYANEIYTKLDAEYASQEAKVREKLEDAINEIFKKIYEGGMSISIDEKYRIVVTVDEVKGYSSEIETSTAQSISVVFAFISGIIKLAKEFSQSEVSENNLLKSEPYPLVMDAPLSNFDKRRIKTVCDTLPKVAEQVIIFIKDTDGDIAESYLQKVIGEKFEFEKINEVETRILER